MYLNGNKNDSDIKMNCKNNTMKTMWFIWSKLFFVGRDLQTGIMAAVEKVANEKKCNRKGFWDILKFSFIHIGVGHSGTLHHCKKHTVLCGSGWSSYCTV